MEEDLTRYSCQIQLPGFGMHAQLLLREARVLIAGAGGLGCPAAQYLAAAGVGTIGIADHDTVSVSNLHRQILYGPGDTGKKKVKVACERLGLQNPYVQVIPHDILLDSNNIASIVDQYDLVVDCTDNFDSRYLINDACVLAGKPVIYGAIYQYEGQVAIWNMPAANGQHTPNYRDIFPEVNAAMIPNCADGGVMPVLAGIIGCLQANEAIKVITGTGEPLAGKLLMYDAATSLSRIISIGAVSTTKIESIFTTTDIPLLTMEELIAHRDQYEVVDVRTAEERAQKNIGGRHVPIAAIETDISYLSSGKPIVMYCASGKRSMEAAKLIKRKYPQMIIYSLKGGI